MNLDVVDLKSVSDIVLLFPPGMPIYSVMGLSPIGSDLVPETMDQSNGTESSSQQSKCKRGAIHHDFFIR